MDAGSPSQASATAPGDALAKGDAPDALARRATLLGLVGQIDPPREEVKLAVAACRAAGIRPIMVTGDHKLTGLAIARELGIAGEGGRAVDGAELERMNEAELEEGLDRIAVFARVHPAQKLRIVEALQARGEVVAMAGDGVNDAPALARVALMVSAAVCATFGWFVWRQADGLASFETARTGTFTVLAACQWFNMLNCQSSTRSVLGLGILRNPWLLAGLAISVVLQAAVLYWPPLGGLFHTVPIAVADLPPLFVVASTVLWVEELRKLAARRRARAR